MRIVAPVAVAGAEQPRDDLVRCSTPAEVEALRGTGKTAWLRGYEAVETSTPWTLLVLARVAARSRVPWIVEGVGPRAAAACIAAGASGLALGPELWPCADSGIDPAHRAALVGARTGRDTEVRDGRRLLTRGRRGVYPAPQNVGLLGAGDTAEEVVAYWRATVASLVAGIRAERALADPFGAGTRLVQGPMANVSERAAFAHHLRASGVLPFAALGALDPGQAEAVLAEWADVRPPWGVGLIGFDVQPHRSAHLAALERAQREGRGPW
jgi:hypothetical protein